MKNSSKRISWVDAAKCCGILMVMYGHNWLDFNYCYYFYAFHMPLFFILAGYTFSIKDSFDVFLKKKAKSLLIPYLLFSLVYIIFYSTLSVTHEGGYSILDEILKFLLQQRHTYLWFLPVLFLSEILVYSLSKWCIRGYVMNIVTAVILFGIGLGLIRVGDYRVIWNADLVPTASAFVFIGILYRNYYETKLPDKSFRYCCSVFALSFIVVYINYIYFGQVDMYNNMYGLFPLFILGAILSSYSLILVLKKIRIPQWMLYVGMSSVLFYGLHRMIIEVCFIIYGKIGLHYDGQSLLSVALAVVNVVIACIILYHTSKFVNNRCPWILGKF